MEQIKDRYIKIRDKESNQEFYYRYLPGDDELTPVSWGEDKPFPAGVYPAMDKIIEDINHKSRLNQLLGLIQYFCSIGKITVWESQSLCNMLESEDRENVTVVEGILNGKSKDSTGQI